MGERCGSCGHLPHDGSETWAEARLSQAMEEVAALRTALVPFAAVAEMLDAAAWPTPDQRWQYVAEWSRRAKALLSPPAAAEGTCAECGGSGKQIVGPGGVVTIPTPDCPSCSGTGRSQ